VKRHDRGIVLMAVLFFVLLATVLVATFLARAVVDGMAASNRDNAASAEALARGGVRLAEAILLMDRLTEQQNEFAADTSQDWWALLSGVPFEAPDGGELRVKVEDAGAKLSLNALFSKGAPRDEKTEIFLDALLTKVIDEIPVRPEQKLYDVSALAANLIDWIDADSARVSGGDEDEYYQAQRPPYLPANRNLLSVDELLLIEGFDAQLVNALRPYVDVLPLSKADGINPNTAPSWVLSLLFHGQPGSERLAQEDTVRRILDIRDQKGILCADEASNPQCRPVGEVVEGEVYPPLSFHADVFRITAEARYGGEVRRTVEAVVDRSGSEGPEILAWRVR
jgi:general secretion pathway protein K